MFELLSWMTVNSTVKAGFANCSGLSRPQIENHQGLHPMIDSQKQSRA